MGAKLFLPMSAMLRPLRTERDALLNRLTELGVLVPGVEKQETERIRDIVQYAEERAAAKVAEALWLPPERPKTKSRREVVDGLREYYHDFVVPRREGRKRLYGGVSLETGAS